MERLRIAFPEDDSFRAFLQRHASASPAEKTWICPTCGTILPREIKPGLYLRRPCPCEERARERREIEALRAQLQTAQAAQTFAWIGEAWADRSLEQQTFASFERERQPKAFDQALAFAHAPQGTLALTGSYGTGKTHLLAALANAHRQAGKPCLYVSAVTLFEVIQERIHNDQDYQSLLKRAVQTPLLLIDDIDKPKASEFRESLYYHIINKRVLARLPIAISCNCRLPELDHWIGGAARSRLMQGLVPVVMNGPDYRMIADARHFPGATP
jgi:DNA replication protein DnaC